MTRGVRSVRTSTRGMPGPRTGSARLAAAGVIAAILATGSAARAQEPAPAAPSLPSASPPSQAAPELPAPPPPTTDAPPPPPPAESVPVAATPPAPPEAPPPVAAPKAVTPPDDDSEPLWTGTARLAGRYYEVGLQSGTGGLIFAEDAGAVGITGVRVFEHHGYLSKLFVAALVAMGQSNGRYVGSTYSTQGNYVVRTDYYRSLTSEERAANAAAVDAAISGEYSWELTYYTHGLFGYEPGDSRATGFDSSLGVDFALGNIGPLPVVLTVGGYGAYVKTNAVWKDRGATTVGATGALEPVSHPTELTYRGLGLFARLHVPVTRYADVYAEWDLNAFTLAGANAERRAAGEVNSSPLKLGGCLNLTDRAYVRAGIIFGGLGFSDGKVGTQLELGVRL
jgi:hypothetical protein